jgi:hypothetical protein
MPTFNNFIRGDGDFAAPVAGMPFPTIVVDEIKFINNITQQQAEDSRRLWHENVPSDENGVWSDLCLEAGTRYWNLHNLNSLKAIAAMYGCVAENLKGAIVNQLLLVQALPIFPAAVASYVTRVNAVQAHRADPGPSIENYHMIDLDDDMEEEPVLVGQVDPDPVLRAPDPVAPFVAPRARPPQRLGRIPGLAPPSESYHLTREAMESLLASVRSDALAGRAPALEAVETPASLSKIEKNEADCQKKVDTMSYFDPTLLSSAHLDKLRTAGLSGRTEAKIASGIYVSSEESVEVERATSFAPQSFMEGMLAVLSMYAKSKVPKIKALLIDRLEWARLMWSHKADNSMKVRYARHFMSDFAKESNWASRYRTDNALMNQYLVPGRSDTHASSNNSSNSHSNSNRRGSSDRRSSGHHGSSSNASRSTSSSRPAKRSRGAGKGGSSGTSGGGMAHCKSRTDPSYGPCKYSPCRYSHSCPLHPRESHTARECQANGTWRIAKREEAHQ